MASIIRKARLVFTVVSLVCLSALLYGQAPPEGANKLFAYPPLPVNLAPSSPAPATTPPADTQGKGVAFGQQVRVWTVWYINTSNCTSAGTGTITASDGPQYGSVSTTTGSLPLPAGYACAGVSLPETTAYYTWTDPTPAALVDYFHLLFDSNGVTAATDWLGLLDGSCSCHPGFQAAGDPTDLGSGNVFEQISDYTTAGQNPLTFVRYYNSLGVPNTFAAELGNNWRSNYDRFLSFVSPTLTVAERPDGQLLNFTLTGGVWTPNTDVDYALTQSGTTWTLKDHFDTVETYSTSTTVQGFTYTGASVDSIHMRDGYTQTLQYSSGLLQSVTDSYGRQLTFTYNGAALSTVTTPDGLILSFAYNTITGGTNNQLASISYSTSPVTSQRYLYANTSLPFNVTSIVDEDNNTYATFTYDQFGRGIESQLGVDADTTTIAYNDTNTISRTVTNALGQEEIYAFSVLQTEPKAQSIQRQATSTTTAATRAFMYDGNGYTASATDWNGNLTTYVNDDHGDPTTINEAVGSPVARTTTIAYDSTCVHLPHTITTVGLTTSFTYDSSCDVLTRTDHDTTTQTVPYSTHGQTRTWTNTWLNFLLASAKTPNGNLTQYGYDSTGALTSTTNGLNQVTNITGHTGGGYPLTIVDPNIVTTALTYNARLWLLTSTVSATGQPSYTTTWGYDQAGNFTSLTLPDNSKLTYSYDAAHRLISVADLFNNSTAYTLDGLGDITLTNVLNPNGTVTRTHSGVFDALGRMLQDIGGEGQTTTYTYDNNGNAVTVTDPDSNLTQQSFDALNRLSTVTYPSPGGTKTMTYDQHDRVLTVTVTDPGPNSEITSYVYDGFGNTILQKSPDSGATVYRYDADANLTQKTDATGAITNNTYDALDRVLTTAYPKDSSENVAYTYDQPGHGFGIGHLTSLTDAVGSLSRSYDERGNMLTDKRTNGANTLNTGYTYDPASRISTIAYPSAAIVVYTRDSMGRIITVRAKASGASSYSSVASAISYKPFGPVAALTFVNAVADARGYDLDYRMTSLADTGAAPVQKIGYAYDPANNLVSIQDNVNAANSQAFKYDSLNRLTQANSATGGYGNFNWTYDPVGNRLTQAANGVQTTYAYTSGSNRLASITTGGATQTVGSTAAGNINSFSPAMNTITALSYNQANRLATVTAGTSAAATYKYDAFGQRLIKTPLGVSPILYQYDQGGDLLEEGFGSSAGPLDYIYLYSQPVATLTATGVFSYLHTDHLGTPQLATGVTQSVVWSAGGYEPFGTTGTVTGTITQNLRFPGQYFDAESAFNHNGFRDYASFIGRYLQSDPAGLIAGNNVYIYANDRPMVESDPLGLGWIIFVNGQQRSGSTVDQLIATLQNVGPSSINLISIWGHGDANFQGFNLNNGNDANRLVFVDSTTVVLENGAQSFPFASLISGKLAPNAQILLRGCNVARGGSNIARALSQELPEATVQGCGNFASTGSCGGILTSGEIQCVNGSCGASDSNSARSPDYWGFLGTIGLNIKYWFTH